MQFKKILPYKLKRLVPMLGLAGASLFMTGCEKEEPIYSVELDFSKDDYSNLIYEYLSNIGVSNAVKVYQEDPYIDVIYLVPDGDWSNFKENDIANFRQKVLDRVFDYSSKVRGKGNLNFYPGAASKIPEDSLWYVSKGWTINKQKQR